MQGLDRIPPGWLIFILIVLNFQGWRIEPNGEQYLTYARYMMDPAWFPDSYWYRDFPGTRYLFQVAVGWVLRYLSFEVVSFGGKLLMAALVAIPLGRLVGRMALSNLALVVILQVIWLSNQALYGGETMVGGFETKHLAYVFALWGVLAALDHRVWQAMLWLGLASLCHLLVGGWLAVVVMGWMLIERQPLVKLIIAGLGYLLLVAPLLWYLYQGLLAEPPPLTEGPSPNWIYTYYRNPHHTTPFHLGFAHLNRYYLPGMVGLLLFGGLSLTRWRQRVPLPAAQRLNHLFWAMLAQQGLALLLAYLDREGTWLKAYPFRPMALMHLLGWLLLARDVQARWGPRLKAARWLPWMQGLLLGLVLLLLGLRIARHTWPRLQGGSDPAPSALVTFAREETPPDAWFVGVGQPLPLAFMREARRNVLVVPKVIPSEPAMIIAWYQRMLVRDTLLAQPARIADLGPRYGLDYAVSPQPLALDQATLVFQGSGYWVYRLP
jgi:hypothetical protein